MFFTDGFRMAPYNPSLFCLYAAPKESFLTAFGGGPCILYFPHFFVLRSFPSWQESDHDAALANLSSTVTSFWGCGVVSSSSVIVCVASSSKYDMVDPSIFTMDLTTQAKECPQRNITRTIHLFLLTTRHHRSTNPPRGELALF